MLYLTDPIDEFVMSALGTFDGKTLTSIDSAELELPGAEPESETKPEEAASGGFARVLDLFRQALGDRVKEVRESKRLTDSPCCLVNVDAHLSTQMQRLLRMTNKDLPASEPHLRGQSRGVPDPATLQSDGQPGPRRLH